MNTMAYNNIILPILPLFVFSLDLFRTFITFAPSDSLGVVYSDADKEDCVERWSLEDFGVNGRVVLRILHWYLSPIC